MKGVAVGEAQDDAMRSEAARDETYGWIEEGREPGTVRIAFDRPVAAEPLDVWRALVDRDRLAGWLNRDMTVDARPGGRVWFAFGTGEECHGTVVVADAARALAYDWRFPGGLRMEVSWALAAAGAQLTSLSLRHDLVPADRGPSFAAGWHAHFDQLDAFLRSEAYDVATRRTEFWGPRVAELEPQYRARHERATW